MDQIEKIYEEFKQKDFSFAKLKELKEIGKDHPETYKLLSSMKKVREIYHNLSEEEKKKIKEKKEWIESLEKYVKAD